jgi:hypothetical protein
MRRSRPTGSRIHFAYRRCPTATPWTRRPPWRAGARLPRSSGACRPRRTLADGEVRDVGRLGHVSSGARWGWIAAQPQRAVAGARRAAGFWLARPGVIASLDRGSWSRSPAASPAPAAPRGRTCGPGARAVGQGQAPPVAGSMRRAPAAPGHPRATSSGAGAAPAAAPTGCSASPPSCSPTAPGCDRPGLAAASGPAAAQAPRSPRTRPDAGRTPSDTPPPTTRPSHRGACRLATAHPAASRPRPRRRPCSDAGPAATPRRARHTRARATADDQPADTHRAAASPSRHAAAGTGRPARARRLRATAPSTTASPVMDDMRILAENLALVPVAE